ncbi:MAG: hypothetical protein RDU20_20125 [Desulfomonilaceae bacterium]|nr:hypothetical protein [Desulfomonilaceae bacterium]
MSNEMLDAVQRHFAYSDEEMELFKGNPRNIEVLMKTREFGNKTIVAEVVESHGCNSLHKVGDKFYLDAAGNLISKLCPTRMCIYAVSALQNAVFATGEFLMAGADPNDMKFRRTGCFDVGLQCGGWGRVVMEVGVEDRKR